MSVSEKIKKIEDKWLHIILPYIKYVFKDKWLPSHDHIHSIRTWNYAKELITSYSINTQNVDIISIENLLIASLFHDTGMSISYDSKHGKISKEICEEFFKTKCSKNPEELNHILDAIEYHDDKSYRKEIFKKSTKKLETLPFLSVADDLDSFGAFGIFRFWEIYVLREYPKHNIPEKVLLSLDSRFNHFNSQFSNDDSLINFHRNRYQKTKLFYNQLLNDCKIDKNTLTNTIKIVNLLDKLIIQDMVSPEKILPHIQSINDNREILVFFTEFVDDCCNKNKHVSKLLT